MTIISMCDGQRQSYNKRGPFANQLWPTGHTTSPTLVAEQNRCDCNILGGPMLAGGFWWSAPFLVMGGWQLDFPQCDWALKHTIKQSN